MRTLSIERAEKQFAELITRVEQGMSVVITRQGREVARLTPAQPSVVRRLPDLSSFRQSIHVRGKPLSVAVAEGRKHERY